jgi:phage replication-related protein YjqB (UPF0714/DUF867 family)
VRIFSLVKAAARAHPSAGRNRAGSICGLWLQERFPAGRPQSRFAWRRQRLVLIFGTNPGCNRNMRDKYPSMTALYDDPLNFEGTTYGKRWKRHEWSQLLEAQVSDNPEIKTIVLAVHGGGIEGGTSELALSVAGYHPATLAPATDCYGFHNVWLFEGLLNAGNSALHVTSANYDDPIALALVQNATRCISIHGCSDDDANGKLQIGGLDYELAAIVLEELALAGIPAEVSTNPLLNGSDPANICNRTRNSGGAQVEIGTSYRASLFAPGYNFFLRDAGAYINMINYMRKNSANAEFWKLTKALRRAMSRVC